jgi:hypothetical protein
MPDPRQPDLWDDGPAAWREVPALVEPAGAGTIQERFLAFHRANPWVAATLTRMARELVARGHERVGIAMLWETLRHRHMTSTTDPTSSFRLNNVYRSRYARMLMDQHADLAGVFETRKLHKD